MEHFTGARVLITGGLGFIGSNLARRLIAAKADVTVVDSLIPEYGGNLFNLEGIEKAVRVNYSDIRDPYSMRFLIQDKDYLFNLAGQTSHMDSMSQPEIDLSINCQAQLSLLETCRKHNPSIRIVFASTRQIYGKPDYLPVDEEHPIRPVDINGINKTAGEWYHLLYNNVHGVRASVLRLTNTFGPCMRIKDARQTFVGIWIRLLLQGSPFEVWGGDQLRDFNYVDDVVEAMLTTATAPQALGRVYNLGGSEVVSLKELADTLVAAHGAGSYRIREFPADRKKIDIGDYYSDYARIEKELGWTPRVPLREGFRRTFDYYAKHLQHYV